MAKLATKLPPPLEKHVKSQILHLLAFLRNQGKIHFYEIYNGPKIIGAGRNKGFIKNPSPGISDLVILVPFWTIWAELKRPKVGRQSPAQKLFQQSCEQMNHKYVIWTSVEEAVKDLEQFGVIDNGTLTYCTKQNP